MTTGCFWFKCLYNTFDQKLGLEVQFESSDDGSDTKDDRTKNTNIKEGGNYFNGQVVDPDVETVDLPGGGAPHRFLSYSDKENFAPKFLDMSELLEGTSIYYIYPRRN